MRVTITCNPCRFSAQRSACRDERGSFHSNRVVRTEERRGSGDSDVFVGYSSSFLSDGGDLRIFHTPTCCDPDTQFNDLAQSINGMIQPRDRHPALSPMSRELSVVTPSPTSPRRLSLPSAPLLHSMSPSMRSPIKFTRSHVVPWTGSSGQSKTDRKSDAAVSSSVREAVLNLLAGLTSASDVTQVTTILRVSVDTCLWNVVERLDDVSGGCEFPEPSYDTSVSAALTV